jgi:hypothetical protein
MSVAVIDFISSSEKCCVDPMRAVSTARSAGPCGRSSLRSLRQAQANMSRLLSARDQTLDPDIDG